MLTSFKNNFLLHAILTLTARHFQITRHNEAMQLPYNFNQIQEKHLQRTLSAFHTGLEKIHQERKYEDALVATSLLLCFYACAIQDFSPSALVPSEDTSFIFLYGTRSLIIHRAEASTGLMRHLIKRPECLSLFLARISPISGPGERLINLINQLPTTSPSLDNKDMYVERVESLTVYFSTLAAHAPDSESVERLSMCFLRWQAACPPAFMSLIRSCDPIALIILAHFYAAAGFVQMKADNLWWWWQDKPKYMVETISEFLLPAWAEWLEWPIEVIRKF